MMPKKNGIHLWIPFFLYGGFTRRGGRRGRYSPSAKRL